MRILNNQIHSPSNRMREEQTPGTPSHSNLINISAIIYHQQHMVVLAVIVFFLSRTAYPDRISVTHSVRSDAGV